MSPYFTCEQGTLYHGDCLEVMKHLPEGSIDLVLTDPPYGTTACKWDTVIPFEDMWERVHRVSKNNGAVVLFGSEPFSSALRMSNVANYKYDWVWVKPKGTGHLNSRRQPMRNKENISVFYKQQCLYKPIMVEGSPYKNKAGKVSEKTSMTDCYGVYANFRYDNKGVRFPNQTLYFGVVGRGTVHPTQKPVALMEYLIKTYTLEGETVLDFTIGSGTTAVACVNTNRKFVGIEQDEKYIEIAKKRVMDAIFAKTEDLENL